MKESNFFWFKCFKITIFVWYCIFGVAFGVGFEIVPANLLRLLAILKTMSNFRFLSSSVGLGSAIQPQALSSESRNLTMQCNLKELKGLCYEDFHVCGVKNALKFNLIAFSRTHCAPSTSREKSNDFLKGRATTVRFDFSKKKGEI